MVGVTSDSLTVTWKSDVMKSKGIKQLLLGVTSIDSKGKHRMLSSDVESENLTMKSLSPKTKYRVTMRHDNKNSIPISLGTSKTWPIGIV